MTLAEVVLGVMFVGLIAYALFGGADFGAGIWDLLAGGTRRGAPQRAVIEHAIGPVWEANHVWLIFVLVVLWTGFPAGSRRVASTLYVPLTLAAFGMIARGAAFAFRKSITTLPMRRFLGAAFAVSSLVTPYFLGAVVGGVASGRVPPGIATGDVVTSWVNPTSTLGGVLAVLDLRLPRRGLPLPRRAARRAPRARGRVPAPGAGHRRGHRPRSGSRASSCCAPTRRSSRTGCSGGRCPWWRCPCSPGWPRSCCWCSAATRWRGVTAALAVATILIGWAAAQYPYVLLPDLTIADAAAGSATLVAMLVRWSSARACSCLRSSTSTDSSNARKGSRRERAEGRGAHRHRRPPSRTP